MPVYYQTDYSSAYNIGVYWAAVYKYFPHYLLLVFEFIAS